METRKPVVREIKRDVKPLVEGVTPTRGELVHTTAENVVVNPNLDEAKDVQVVKDEFMHTFKEEREIESKLDKGRDVETVGALAVYRVMMSKLEDIYTVSLALENDELLADVLKSIEGVKVKVNAITEKLEMDIQMAEDVKRYEEREIG